MWVLFLDPDGTVKAHQKISATQGGFTGTLDDRDFFGSSVAALGDLDGDGVGDLAVGAKRDDDGGFFRGAVWVLFLDADGMVKSHQKISDTQGGFTGTLDDGDLFGSSVAALGDLDGDGVPDLLVGAPSDDDGGPDHGALWLLQLEGIATVGFESGDDQARTALVNGQDISSPPEFGRTLELASSGANLGPAIFDSTPGGPNGSGQDQDLLVGLGNLLILQESRRPTQTVPGFFDVPLGDPDGGDLSFDFHSPVSPQSVVLVDLDPPPNQGATVTLTDERLGTRFYAVPPGWTGTYGSVPGWRTLDLTTLDPQPGAGWRVATAVESAGFDSGAAVRIVIHLSGLGAIDDLRWDPHPDT